MPILNSGKEEPLNSAEFKAHKTLTDPSGLKLIIAMKDEKLDALMGGEPFRPNTLRTYYFLEIPEDKATDFISKTGLQLGSDRIIFVTSDSTYTNRYPTENFDGACRQLKEIGYNFAETTKQAVRKFVESRGVEGAQKG